MNCHKLRFNPLTQRGIIRYISYLKIASDYVFLVDFQVYFVPVAVTPLTSSSLNDWKQVQNRRASLNVSSRFRRKIFRLG